MHANELINTLVVESSKMLTALVACQVDNKDLGQRVAALNKESIENAKSYTKLFQEYLDLESENSRLQSEKFRQAVNIKALQEKNASLREIIRELRDEKEFLQGTVESLEAQVSSADNAVFRLTDSLEDAYEELREARAKADALEDAETTENDVVTALELLTELGESLHNRVSRIEGYFE